MKPGWRAWNPKDLVLTISEVNCVEEYHEHLETDFLPTVEYCGSDEVGDDGVLRRGCWRAGRKQNFAQK